MDARLTSRSLILVLLMLFAAFTPAMGPYEPPKEVLLEDEEIRMPTSIGPQLVVNVENLMGFGSSNIDRNHGFVGGPNGASYVIGEFQGTLTFGNYSLSSSGSYFDGYVAKMTQGNWDWAVKIGGTSTDRTYGLAVDYNGNAYVTGNFYGTCHFYDKTGQSSGNLSSAGSADLYVAKLKSDGSDWDWLAKIGSSGYSDGGNDIVLDNSGYAYVSGYIGDNSSIYGHDGEFFDYEYTNGGLDAFVGKIDSSGDWKWIQTGGSSANDAAVRLAIGSNGSVVTGGYYQAEATFGSTTLSHWQDKEAFVAKVDSNGWIFAKGGTGNGDNSVQSVKVDASGDIYYMTKFSSNLSMSTGFSSTYSNTAVIGKISGSTNQYVWHNITSSTGVILPINMALSPDGNLSVVGVYDGTVNFGNGESFTRGGTSGQDAYVQGFDTSNGNTKYVFTVGNGGTNDDITVNDLMFDSSPTGGGSSYIVAFSGYFKGTATFDSGNSLTSAGNEDGFITKVKFAEEGCYIDGFDYNNATSWVHCAGTSSDMLQATGTAVDSGGNSFHTGYFTGTAVFGDTILTSEGGEDIFIAKFDSNGNWAWAVNAGGPSDDVAWGIALDSSSNAYITGEFDSHATFGSTNIFNWNYPASGVDIFVAKINGIGVWQWVDDAGGSNNDFGKGIAVDSTGNVYITGHFAGTANFGSNSLTSGGSDDTFVAKLNVQGTWSWAAKADCSSSDKGTGIAVDSSGNAYVSGHFYGTISFGNVPYYLTSSGTLDIFIAKLSSSGTWQWGVKAGGSAGDLANEIAVDSSGNAYVTGYFTGTASFADSGASGIINLTSSGVQDIFIAKLNSSGSWQWVKKAGGSSTDVGVGIAVDSSGNVYATGRFKGTAIFGSTSLTSGGNSDAFIGQLSSSGNWVWANNAGGTGGDSGISIAVDSNGVGYMGGYFSGDAGIGIQDLTCLSTYCGMFIKTPVYTVPLSISTNGLGTGTVGTSYSFTLSATGANTPFSWSTSSTMPAGMSLSSSGVLSGTPTGAGTYPLNITLADAQGSTVSKILTLVINSGSSPPANGTISANLEWNISVEQMEGTWSASNLETGYTYYVVWELYNDEIDQVISANAPDSFYATSSTASSSLRTWGEGDIPEDEQICFNLQLRNDSASGTVLGSTSDCTQRPVELEDVQASEVVDAVDRTDGCSASSYYSGSPGTNICDDDTVTTWVSGAEDNYHPENLTIDIGSDGRSDTIGIYVNDPGYSSTLKNVKLLFDEGNGYWEEIGVFEVQQTAGWQYFGGFEVSADEFRLEVVTNYGFYHTVLFEAKILYRSSDEGSWEISNLYASTAEDVGQYSSLAIDSNNDLHASWHKSSGSAQYGYVPPTSEIGITSTMGFGTNGTWTSLALDSQENVFVSMYDANNGNLVVWTNVSGSWSSVVVDSSGDAGKYSSIAIDSNDHVHVAYYESQNGGLKHAHFDGSSWTTSGIAGTGDVGYFSSLAIDSNDGLHVAYFNEDQDDLMYAYNDGPGPASGWATETVDNGPVGHWISIAVDSNDIPHISYRNTGSLSLKYATGGSEDWTVEDVDNPSADVGRYTSIAVDSYDVPHISYYDHTNKNLKYATWDDGDSWEITEVDSDDDVGKYSSIVIKEDIHISYYDETNGNLKYAFHSGGGDGDDIVITPTLQWDEEGDDLEVIWEVTGLSMEYYNVSWTLFLDQLGDPLIDDGIDQGYANSNYFTGQRSYLLGNYNFSRGDDICFETKLYLGEPLGDPLAWDEVCITIPLEWTTETLHDYTGSSYNVLDMVLDSNDTPHLCFLDNSGDMVYSMWNGTSWVTSSLSDWENMDLEFCSIAVDSSDLPAIAFSDQTDLYSSIQQSGGGWSTTQHESGVNQIYPKRPKVGFDAYDNFYMSYQMMGQSTDDFIRLVEFHNNIWDSSDAVTYVGENVGFYGDMVVEDDGTIHIVSASGVVDYNLVYSVREAGSTSWSHDGDIAEGVNIWDTSLAIDSVGNPHISYTQGGSGSTTNYIFKESNPDGNSEWAAMEIVEYVSGWYTELALDSDDNPYITYLDVDTPTSADIGHLMYAWRLGEDEWEHFEITRDEKDQSDLHDPSPIAIDADGYPKIAYSDADNGGTIEFTYLGDLGGGSSSSSVSGSIDISVDEVANELDTELTLSGLTIGPAYDIRTVLTWESNGASSNVVLDDYTFVNVGFSGTIWITSLWDSKNSFITDIPSRAGNWNSYCVAVDIYLNSTGELLEELFDCAGFNPSPNSDEDWAADFIEASIEWDTEEDAWDTDGDGWGDWMEYWFGGNPIDPVVYPVDNDGDGLANELEWILDTDPDDFDSDGDGVSDLDEFAYGGHPNDFGITPHDGDFDGCWWEWEDEVGLNPMDPDSDGDGVYDCFEPDPFNASATPTDTDGDGLPDEMEWNLETDDNEPDSDGDGMPDSAEVASGFDPLDGYDFAGDYWRNQSRNLAKMYGVASASSTIAGSSPSNILDDNGVSWPDYDTYWQPDGGCGQWIEVDLGSVYRISAIEFSIPFNDDDFPRATEVQLREDVADGWMTVETWSFSDTDYVQGIYSADPGLNKARYVRLSCEDSTDDDGNEMEVRYSDIQIFDSRNLDYVDFDEIDNQTAGDDYPGIIGYLSVDPENQTVSVQYSLYDLFVGDDYEIVWELYESSNDCADWQMGIDSGTQNIIGSDLLNEEGLHELTIDTSGITVWSTEFCIELELFDDFGESMDHEVQYLDTVTGQGGEGGVDPTSILDVEFDERQEDSIWYQSFTITIDDPWLGFNHSMSLKLNDDNGNTLYSYFSPMDDEDTQGGWWRLSTDMDEDPEEWNIDLNWEGLTSGSWEGSSRFFDDTEYPYFEAGNYCVEVSLGYQTNITDTPMGSVKNLYDKAEFCFTFEHDSMAGVEWDGTEEEEKGLIDKLASNAIVGPILDFMDSTTGQIVSVLLGVLAFAGRMVLARGQRSKNKRVRKFSQRISKAETIGRLKIIEQDIEKANDKNKLPRGGFGDLMEQIETQMEKIGFDGQPEDGGTSGDWSSDDGADEWQDDFQQASDMMWDAQDMMADAKEEASMARQAVEDMQQQMGLDSRYDTPQVEKKRYERTGLKLSDSAKSAGPSLPSAKFGGGGSGSDDNLISSILSKNIGAKDPCHCGSKKLYKDCHMKKDRARRERKR